MKDIEVPVNHTVLESIVLSLAPGLLVLLFLILVAPPANQMGLSSTLVIFAAIAVVLVPVELGYLLIQGKKLNGRYTLRGIIFFTNKIPLWQFVVSISLLLIWMIFCFGFLAAKLDPYFLNHFFHWLPSWFFNNGVIQNNSQNAHALFLITMILGFVFNGIIGPIVEELYFRGYLLPRLSHLGGWAPLLNCVLFSLYHFFSPWQNVTRIIALLPFVYVVWWKRNIVIGIITHCLLNTTGMVAMIFFFNKP